MPTSSQFRYLDAEAIRKLGRYEFAPRLLAEGYLAGRHTARAHGASTEFRDYRPYVPGDDPRAVDWRVYARTDRFYLRTYERETHASCYIFLDSSASMGFGRPSKLEYASFFAAALCWLVLRSADRVSLQIFDEGIRQFFPPGGTQRHLHSLLHALETNRPGNRTSVAEALRRSFPLLPRRGLVVVISDFFDDPAAIFAALSPYLHRGCQVSLFHILAPEEWDLEDRGLAAFVDLETQRRVVAHTDDLRAAYGAALQAHIRALREYAERRQVEYTVARTDTHYFHLFDRFLR